MKSFVHKYKILAASGGAIALILLAVLWDASAAVRGRLSARIAIASGHYRLLGYGLPGFEREEYVRLLRTRYGVEFEEIAKCIVSRSLVAYADAYNSISGEAIEKKFGHNVLENTFEDARRTWGAQAR
jgi:hypothetical protein